MRGGGRHTKSVSECERWSAVWGSRQTTPARSAERIAARLCELGAGADGALGLPWGTLRADADLSQGCIAVLRASLQFEAARRASAHQLRDF